MTGYIVQPGRPTDYGGRTVLLSCLPTTRTVPVQSYVAVRRVKALPRARRYINWTPELKANVALMLANGQSFGRIAKFYGITRGMVAGFDRRNRRAS
jgi:hypothetical protein